MTTHQPSIPLDARFTPPPPIALRHAREPHEPREEALSNDSDLTAPSPSIAAQNAKTRWARLAAFLAVIAVPAMAAPGDFGAMAGDAPMEPQSIGARGARDGAMAFERPGMSFPGSAFYYLADPPKAALVALPKSDPNERGAVGAPRVGAMIDAGPAARAFSMETGTHYRQAKDCLAQAIWYEAASESEAGQRAVAQVVLNRVAHPSWPGSVCGVVYQGSQRRTGCQFSFTCDGSLARRRPSALKGKTWEKAQNLAAQALNGSVYAAIGHATHYHTLWVDPYWARTLDPVGVIGAHRFYRNRGRAGEKAAFNAAYDGAEPTVSPEGYAADRGPQSARDDAPAIAARIAPEPVLENAQKAPSGSATSVSDDAVATGKAALSSAGQTRKEYAKAGQWKVDPATLGLKAKGKPDPAPEPAQDALPKGRDKP